MSPVSIAQLCRILVGSALILGPHFPQCEGHLSRRQPLAGIFGFGDNNKRDEKGDGQSAPAFTDKPMGARPPPPRRPPVPQMGQGSGRPAAGDRFPRHPPLRPPPPPQNTAVNEPSSINEDSDKPNSSESAIKSTEPLRENTTIPVKDVTSIAEEANGEYQKNRPPPPPPPQWGMNSKQGSIPAPQPGWGALPPREQYNEWQGSYYNDPASRDQVYYQSELEESLARENEMITQLDNLTGTIIVMEQREELHLRQLDVLTERIMDVEAQAAGDRNLLVEYDANCTALAMTIESMQGDMEEWQQRCDELNERKERDQEKLDDLKRRIKEKEAEGEELAIAIENVRLAEKRREASQARRKNTRRGLFSWIASFFVSTDDSYDEMSREEAYETAKSTLLRALQSERSNVHELDAIVLSLQQNNSAIAEMVESRDSIIDELNNRIAVFEEDKVVLKAALRQLQKEIKEETPKAEKLMDDLASAEQEITRLTSEMNGVIQTHQEEVLVLQRTISSKQDAISETESNLTAIGTYVDKLEERLTSFAITRRDMEKREKKCKEIEEAAINIENDKKMLERKVEEFAKEQEELKMLLEELAAERTTLQKENRKLYTEREFRIDEQEQMQGKHDTLVNETNVLSEQVFEWKSKYDSLVPELEVAQRTCVDLEKQLNTAMEMKKELESSRLQARGLDEELEKVRGELNELKEENACLMEQEKNRTAQLELFQNREREAELRFRQQSQLPDARLERNVPFRELRKKLSKATGIHGLVTPSSKTEAMLKRNARSQSIRPTSLTMPPIPENKDEQQGKINTISMPPNPPPVPQQMVTEEESMYPKNLDKIPTPPPLP